MQSRRSQCFRKLPRFPHLPLPPSFALTIQPHFSCPSKKSIWLCKVQLGPRGGLASCRGLDARLTARTRSVLQACPTGGVKDRPKDQRVGTTRLPFHTASHLLPVSVSLSDSLQPWRGWLSEAEEINNQVERLKSPAQEAGATLLRAQQTNTSLRAEQLDGQMSGCTLVAPGH